MKENKTEQVTLTEEQIEKNKVEFLDILRSTQKEGIEKLIEWLLKTDFFVAPASSRYHENYKGGLCEHSLVVYNKMCDLLQCYNGQQYDLEEDREKEYKKLLPSVKIVSLLHDACKINYYKLGTRNVKNEETGQWEKVPTYSIDDSFPMGHAEKSVFLIGQLIRLTPVEAMAIRWHMGPWGASEAEQRTMGEAFQEYPLATLLHSADMWATYLK